MSNNKNKPRKMYTDEQKATLASSLGAVEIPQGAAEQQPADALASQQAQQ